MMASARRHMLATCLFVTRRVLVPTRASTRLDATQCCFKKCRRPDQGGAVAHHACALTRGARGAVGPLADCDVAARGVGAHGACRTAGSPVTSAAVWRKGGRVRRGCATPDITLGCPHTTKRSHVQLLGDDVAEYPVVKPDEQPVQIGIGVASVPPVLKRPILFFGGKMAS